ncbi:cation diffusion facilitator family transporter [Escherichia coli]|nr:cation diffusion facilitator family transporter [Escherichia coli]
MEKHSHEHHHHHDISSISKNKLFFVIIFNFIIALAEVIGGSISGSLSLISDALHNLSDTASLILSYVSIKISEKPKNKAKTYGYKRANILAAFINSAALIGISIFLGVQALEKLTSLKKINANIVIVVALIGLLGNFLSVIILKKGAEKSLNVRSSYLNFSVIYKHRNTEKGIQILSSGIENCEKTHFLYFYTQGGPPNAWGLRAPFIFGGANPPRNISFS